MNKLIKSIKFTAGIAMLTMAAIGLGAIIACFTMANNGSNAPVCALMFLLPVPALLLAFAGLSTLDSLN